uniref:Mannose-6-phosphate isomerase, type 2 n=1 Tax=Chlorobium chlorochromatii (strain CaD3) TaxID=340177 RepID=Q3APK3_CHLCH
MMSTFRQHVYAVVMGGGFGKKLWPVSKRKRPKQFIDLFNDGTMILKTLQRIAGLVPEENILVITSALGKQLLLELSPHFQESNIIVEPACRNTAPCIALASAHIKKRDPEALTIILPADHLVRDSDAFELIMQAALLQAQHSMGLVTLGIMPTRPETAYGYIQATESLPMPEGFGVDDRFKLFAVKAFAEKPDYATALNFLETRDFYWNSGIFVWHIKAIWQEFQRSMPDLYHDFLTIYNHLGTQSEQKIIEDVYSWIHPCSIDRGIMEKAERVFVLTGEFGWTDLGCWDEVLHVAGDLPVLVAEQEGGHHMEIACENLFVKTMPDKVIATIGVKDVMIIETDKALLVCHKGQSHRVREIVDMLRRAGLEDYL